MMKVDFYLPDSVGMLASLRHRLFLDLFTTEENVFEFLVAELFVASLIMLIDHLLDFGQSHLLSKLLHGEPDVLCRDEARVVRVELLENSFQF